MKLGHAAALLCLLAALLGGALFYWDLQDDSFSPTLLTLPILFGLLALAFGLFPGGPTTFRGSSAAPGQDAVSYWLSHIPPLHRRVWLLTAALGMYLALGASHYLQSGQFFSLSGQLSSSAALVLGCFLMRKKLKDIW